VSIRKVGRVRLADRRLVMASRRQIETVADALLQRGKLTGEEILELVPRFSAWKLRAFGQLQYGTRSPLLKRVV
jgi:hypothetical protein